MWALPNIERLNQIAADEHKARQRETKKARKKRLAETECEYCENPAVTHEPYYDIFGDPDIPKGEIHLCEEHDPNETYFWCSGCSRYHVQNYTWELYFKISEDGEPLCLRCFFHEEIAKEENWITHPEQITWERVRKTPHLIAVESDYWQKDLVFIGNVTFDSSSGEEVTGFSSTSGSPETGIAKLKQAVKAGILQTYVNTHRQHRDCILILDGGYQFAVSIGVYARRGEGKAK